MQTARKRRSQVIWGSINYKPTNLMMNPACDLLSTCSVDSKDESCLSTGSSEVSSIESRIKVGNQKSNEKLRGERKKMIESSSRSSSIRRRAKDIVKFLSSESSSEVHIRQILGGSTDTSKALRMVILYLIACTLFVTVGALTTTIITSPDGDIIECTEKLAQSTFKHHLLKDHKLQEPPTNLPNVAKNEDEVSSWQIWHGNGSKCPEGTIPIRKVVSYENGTTNSGAGAEVTNGHEYAIGYLSSKPHIYGTKVTMSVGHPKVEQVGEFSLGQIWLLSGSYNNGDMNTIEAGWQVYPEQYLDSQPRLFIFWTNDAYTRERCYNLRCPGFIQTSGSVLIEGAISRMSPQTELTIQIWKDPILGHWWLSVGPNNDNELTPVGYWPTEIFTCLTDYAEQVQWGGEIVNRNISGRHTTTQMGSGYLANSAKAAYMTDLEIVVDRDFQPTYDLKVGATNPTYYNITKSSTTRFSYGGPEHAGAVHLIIDFIFLYFCFSFFLLF